MKFRYREPHEMKDSGVEWLGIIPKEWEIKRIRHIIKEPLKYGANESAELDDIALPRYIRITDFGDDGKLKESTFKSLEYEKAKEYFLNEGDILFARSGATVGKTFQFKNYNGKACFAGYLIKATSNKKIIISDFLYNFTKTKNYENWKNSIFMQATIQNIGADKYKELKLCIPYIKEQQKIATFLDQKTAEFDNIIAKKQVFIDKLKETQSILISEVITGKKKIVEENGQLKINNRKIEDMKDSNHKWIGNIPKNWEITSFKYVLNERNEKNDPIKTNERLSLSIDKGVTLYSEKTTNLDRFKEDITKYKIAHEGDLVLNSMNMIVGAVGISDYFGLVSPVYYTYYDNETNNITAKYCDYLFRSKTIKKVLFSMGKGIMSIDRGDDKINTCRLKISRDDLRTFKIPVPPVEEQFRIVNLLNDKCRSIDNTIKKINIQIAKLKEAKQSLISVAVTGKIEVM